MALSAPGDIKGPNTNCLKRLVCIERQKLCQHWNRHDSKLESSRLRAPSIVSEIWYSISLSCDPSWDGMHSIFSFFVQSFYGRRNYLHWLSLVSLAWSFISFQNFYILTSISLGGWQYSPNGLHSSSVNMFLSQLYYFHIVDYYNVNYIKLSLDGNTLWIKLYLVNAQIILSWIWLLVFCNIIHMDSI